MDAGQLPAEKSTHFYFQWLQLQALDQSGAPLDLMNGRLGLGGAP